MYGSHYTVEGFNLHGLQSYGNFMGLYFHGIATYSNHFVL